MSWIVVGPDHQSVDERHPVSQNRQGEDSCDESWMCSIYTNDESAYHDIDASSE